MHALFPFNLERALRVTSRRRAMANEQGTPLRRGELLAFDGTSFDRGSVSSQRLCRPPGGGLPDRLVSLEHMLLCGPAHSVVDGGSGLLLTLVLRHSIGGLHWRDSHGQAARLPAGGLFMSQSRRDGLLELSPAGYGEPCQCVQVLIRTELRGDLALQVAPEDFIFCNSSEACVRVLLGSYREHWADFAEASRLNLYDIDLAPLAELEIPLGADRAALALVTTGSVQYQGRVLEPMSAIAFPGREPLARLASQTGASLLWLDMPNAPYTLAP